MHFIQLTVELGFYYSIIPKPFVTTACKFNSSRKFSLFFTHFSSSAPAKPKFCNPYFYCLRPRRNTILQIINAVFLGYFRNVFIVFIIEIKHNLTFSFQNFGKLVRNDIKLEQRHIQNTYNEFYYLYYWGHHNA